IIASFATVFEGTREIIVNTNAILKQKTRPNMFVTMVMCSLDPGSNKVNYTSAGHDQILHYQAASKQTVICEKGGMALGMVPDVSKIVKDYEVTINPGDYMILYTDGVIEAWDTTGKECYGMDRFKSQINRI